MTVDATLKKNLAFHAILASEINKTPYGQLTGNVKIENGVVILTTLNIVKNIRKKYSVKEMGKDEV
jgi:hypothetical protein